MIGDNEQGASFVEKDKSKQVEDRIIGKWNTWPKPQVTSQNFFKPHSFPMLYRDQSRHGEGTNINPVCNISRPGFKSSTENAQYSAELSTINDIGSNIPFYDPKTALKALPEKFIDRESIKKHSQYLRNTAMLCLHDTIEYQSEKYGFPRRAPSERQQPPYRDVTGFEGPNLTQLPSTNYAIEDKDQSNFLLSHQKIKENYLRKDGSNFPFLSIPISTFFADTCKEKFSNNKKSKIRSISNDISYMI